ncbi:hypothetical protein F4777DRAFT_123739 [Nemania sp. FL0916]|nr:hypothetical protein F4777DRAFT_123739 [Nemania sp. FL0916]
MHLKSFMAITAVFASLVPAAIISEPSNESADAAQAGGVDAVCQITEGANSAIQEIIQNLEPTIDSLLNEATSSGTGSLCDTVDQLLNSLLNAVAGIAKNVPSSVLGGLDVSSTLNGVTSLIGARSVSQRDLGRTTFLDISNSS